MKASAIIVGWEGSPAELSEMLEKMQGPHIVSSALTPSHRPGSALQSTHASYGSFPWTNDHLGAFWSHLHQRDFRKNQVSVLEVLAQAGGSISREQLLKKTKISQEALKGVLSSLTRNAKRITKYEEVRVIEQGSDGKSYVLPEPLLKFVCTKLERVKKKGE